MTVKPWLQRDPDNGLLVGPSGCHYSNEHQAVHYDLLQLCGCGLPEDAYNFCRDVLILFDRRGCHDKPPTKEWVNSEEELTRLILQRPEITAHVLTHLFDHLNLLEHGSSVFGSWLTANGERIVDMSPMTRELMEDNTFSCEAKEK